MNVSVIIPTWNGLSILKKHLENTILASPEASEFIIVDDASDDNSVDYLKQLKKKYPSIRIYARKKHYGFGKNSNFAVKKAKGDLVVMLNNDLEPQPGYISVCLKHFKDPTVFGVGFAEIGRENYGRITWQDGYLQISPGKASKTHISAWISGGSSIVRRSEFLKLGGFDSIYEPFYFEDTDLGLRAWMSGYKLVWEPKAVVDHQHEYTTSRFPKKFLTYVKERNHLICTIRNIKNKKMLWYNYFMQFIRVLTGPNYIKIILAANRQLKSHSKPICSQIKTETEILSLFK